MKVEATKVDIKEEIRKTMNEFKCFPEVAALNYKDLCIHLNLDLPKGFKMQKFYTFGRIGNPLAHLRAYCDQWELGEMSCTYTTLLLTSERSGSGVVYI